MLKEGAEIEVCKEATEGLESEVVGELRRCR